MLRFITLLAVAYVSYAALLFVLQRWAMYPGARMEPLPPGTEPVVEIVRLTTRVGQVEAWYLAPHRGSDSDSDSATLSPAVILFHGNAEFIDDWPELVRPLREMGVAVLLVEYPGYGRSDGKPSQAAIMDGAVEGYDWLAASPEVDGDRIFAMGRSLGAAVAAALSECRPIAGVILWSPFSSTGAIAWRSYGLPPALARDPFDSRDAVSRFGGPVLIFHGRQDRVIPYRHATVLADASPRARLVSWDCGHNDCPPSWSALWTEIGTFVADIP